MSNIYNRISIFRIEKGLSRNDLAQRVEVNPQTIGFLERGTYSPSVELALRLAKELDVRVDELFSLEPFPSLKSQLRAEGDKE